MLLLVLAGAVFYPRLQAWFTPVPAVQIQVESSVLPDTAPNCTANPRTAAVLRSAMRDQTDAAVYDCDAATLEACMAELLDDPELWVRSYQYTVHGGLNAHITVTFDWVYPDDGPARRAQLARTADGLLAAAPAGDYPRALYLYDWLLTHVRYVARETYDQTAYAAVCEGEAVCGGIAAYKACEVLRGLQRAGCEVRVTMTADATRFVGDVTFEALSGSPVATSLYDWPDSAIPHIALAEWADVAVVVPATANVLAKMACGIADDCLTTTLLACACPVLAAPGMNVHMWQSRATQANVETLRALVTDHARNGGDHHVLYRS